MADYNVLVLWKMLPGLVAIVLRLVLLFVPIAVMIWAFYRWGAVLGEPWPEDPLLQQRARRNMIKFALAMSAASTAMAVAWRL